MIADILEIIGVVVGLAYLYLEYKANVWLWLAGIIMPAIYIYVYYDAGFYADMGINIYYLLAGVYGWALWLGKGRRRRKWRRGAQAAGGGTASHAGSGSGSAYGSGSGSGSGQPSSPLPVTRMPWRFWFPIMGVALVFFVGITYVLINFTDSTVPYGDSFTTALSVVALWMLARKYAEQWLVWIVVDAVCAGLYFYKELYPTAVLYAFYSVVAVFGYLKWVKMAAAADEVRL